MTLEVGVKDQVRKFYEAVGWQQIGKGLYQNARYEDLRPVSREYLHRCHLRVAHYLPAEGEYLLDAGSGPIQYPEYLEYSRGFRYRVCLDISRLALTEARERLGAHGLCVLGDVARLPFDTGAFAGLVSLHTIHHLPADEHEVAVRGFYRSLQSGGRAVVVYSWGERSGLMRLAAPLMRLASGVRRLFRRLRGSLPQAKGPGEAERLLAQPGTYTFRHDYEWFQRTLGDLAGFEIRVWRSVSTEFLRAFIHPKLLGGPLLKLLYRLEERLPHFLGRHGQYPMVLFQKDGPSRVNGRGRGE